MKKFLYKTYALFAVFLLVFIMASCSHNAYKEKESVQLNNATPAAKKESRYTSYVSGASNSILGIKKEVSWGGSYFKRTEAQKNKSITFDGVQYYGSYEESVYGSGDWIATDKYSDGKITLKFRADNGNFVGFVDESTNVKRKHIQKQNIENSKEYAEKNAQQYASKYVDISKYTLDEYYESSYITSVDGQDFEMNYHVFRYRKYINGYRTNDYVYIKISGKGVLWSLSVSHLGEFDNIPKNFVDEEQLKVAINNKIIDIFSNSEETIETYEIKKQLLSYSPDGQVVMISHITIYSPSERINGTYLELTTMLGNNTYETCGGKA